MTRSDGSRAEFASVQIARDTLRGERWRADSSGRAVLIAVPLDSVRRLETRRTSASRSVAVLGGVLLAAAALLALALSTADSGGWY